MFALVCVRCNRRMSDGVSSRGRRSGQSLYDTIKPWCVDVAGALERARARVYQSVCWAVEPRVNPVQYKILVYFHIGPISASILVVGGKFGGPAR